MAYQAGSTDESRQRRATARGVLTGGAPAGNTGWHDRGWDDKLSAMSTVQEIEQALDRLPAREREEFETRLLARRCGLDALSGEEYEKLLASLDEAECDIDAGRTVSGNELRQSLRSWAGT